VDPPRAARPGRARKPQEPETKLFRPPISHSVSPRRADRLRPPRAAGDRAPPRVPAGAELGAGAELPGRPQPPGLRKKSCTETGTGDRDRAASPQRRRHTEPPARAASDRAASDRAATRCPRPPPADPPRAGPRPWRARNPQGPETKAFRAAVHQHCQPSPARGAGRRRATGSSATAGPS
jgi:hypothetical protein